MMIRIFTCRFITSAFLFAFMTGSQARSQAQQEKSGNAFDPQLWVKTHFAKGMVPPFSFKYGGIDSKTFIKGWSYSAEKQNGLEPNTEEYIFSYQDNKSGLVVKCLVTSYMDFPAVEWILKFSNRSASNTPLIENTEVISYPFGFNQKGSFVLHRALGSNAQRSDFQPIDQKLQIGESVSMMPAGGRSSDNTALPFFNIEAPGKQGVMVAVGWTGSWRADVSQVDEKTVHVSSGMGKMHLVLYPGEEIRTPRICLLILERG